MEDIRIPEFYAGREIFITGGTGFMGKVLIEKLLRSCPEIKRIYLLMRTKKSVEPKERVKNMADIPLFEKLKKENPEALDKIVPVNGDMMSLGLGISDEDKKLLSKVSIVFHSAANVRFDEPLQEAIFMNTRGTREVMELAKTMPDLKVLMHVSTGYCNSDHKLIEEKLYPEHVNWREAIKIAETADDHTLRILTEKYIGELHNTYVFTKNLSEHVVQDYSKELPVVIFRPTIVISSYEEPVPGWVDNFNGPMGMVIGAAKGVLRSIYVDENIVNDFMPVDIAIKAMIVAAWKRGLEKIAPEKVPIYNCSSSNLKKATIGEIISMGLKFSEKYFVDDPIWTVGGKLTNIYIEHYTKVLFLHLLPALVIDTLLKCLGHKPILSRIQRKVYIANKALHYFLTQTWIFKNDQFISLIDIIPDKDRLAFDFNFEHVDKEDYFERAVRGGKIYLMKEKLEDMWKAEKQYRRMKIIDRIVRYSFYLGVFYFVWKIVERCYIL